MRCHRPKAKPLISLVMLTVLLSVLLHGVTARPLARRYGEQATNLDGRRRRQ